MCGHAFSMDIILKTKYDVIFFISSFLVCNQVIFVGFFGNVGHEKYSSRHSLRQHITSAYGNRMINVRPRHTEYFNYQLTRRGNQT